MNNNDNNHLVQKTFLILEPDTKKIKISILLQRKYRLVNPILALLSSPFLFKGEFLKRTVSVCSLSLPTYYHLLFAFITKEKLLMSSFYQVQ